MPDRHDLRRVRRVVELLTTDSHVSLGAVLYTKTKTSEVRELRDQAVWLLRHDGGWTFEDIAVVFEAYGDHTAALRAFNRAHMPREEIREAAQAILRRQP